MRRIVLFIWCSCSAAGAASAVGCGPTDASTEDAERGKCYIDDMICRDGQCYCFVKRGPDEWSEDECGDELFCYTEPPRCECTRPLPQDGRISPGGGDGGGGGNGGGGGDGGGNGGGGDGGGEGEGKDPAEGEGEACDSPPCGCNGDPPWFDGEWLVHYSNIDTHGYDFDILSQSLTRRYWADTRRTIEQDGCQLKVLGIADTALNGLIRRGDEGGEVNPPTMGFAYRAYIGSRDAGDSLITFTGELLPDHTRIRGTCDGEFVDITKSPEVLFHISCDFVLDRYE